MPFVRVLAAALAGAVLVPRPSPAEEARVHLPLGLWHELRTALTPATPEPPARWSSVDRRVDGVFRRGLLEAVITARFVVHSTDGWTEVPVLDASASLARVTLDGSPASVRRVDDMYVLGVERPGDYTLEAKFYLGREQDRFARRLHFRLPPAGPTRLSIRVPETDIEPSLAHGVLTVVRDPNARDPNARDPKPVESGTRLVGQIDATGEVDLTWTRRITHRSATRARVEFAESTLFTVQEALVTGVSVFDVEVREGETDRLEFRVPSALEVVRVEGPPVLQWHTETGRLTVLLRHLVADDFRISVHFQRPVADPADVPLEMPLPPEDAPMTGLAGAQAAAGLDVEAQRHDRAERLERRELPPALTDLTTRPMLFGFRHVEAPDVRLAITRRAQVELTGTVVDEIEASTLRLEDGTEVTKVKLHMRNNTRQYLGVRLPDGARLTHALIDGQPLRPAVSTDADANADAETLLFPLRQSERLGSGGVRSHVVRHGETLGSIAYIHYANPQRWLIILEANRDQLGEDTDLAVGQTLRIPSARGVEVEESRFLIELAYGREREPMKPQDLWGRTALELPEIDVDAINATWHVYLPEAVEPLAFDGNLVQYSAIRYDPFRRLRSFLRRAMFIGDAEAGGYRSILDRRRSIYLADVAKRGHREAVLGSFPLVGERYRFKQLLIGTAQSRLEVTWVADGFATALRWGAMLVAFLCALLFVRPGRRAWQAALAVAGFGLLLWLGHYILGVNRRIVLAVDLALVVHLLRHRAGDWWQSARARLAAPGGFARAITVGNLLIAIGVFATLRMAVAFPMLMSLIALAGLGLLWRWRPSDARRLASAGAMLLAVSALGPTSARAEPDFDALLSAQNEDARRGGRSFGEITEMADGSDGSRVELPLADVVELGDALDADRRARQRRPEPAVVMGAARYRGSAVAGALALTVELDVTLGRPGAWKSVPLVGEDVVLVAARTAEGPIAVSHHDGYHVWPTQRAGPVALVVEILVPARGPRGSIEYELTVARTPVTRFSCRFPSAGLEPRIDSAVQSEVRHAEGATELDAVLAPGVRIHLVGFRDLGDGDDQDARVYAENLDLVSIGDGAVDVFSVVRYSILYAGVRSFRMRIPAGVRVLSAEGEGAFRYTLRPQDDGGAILEGETAFPIRDRYEISIHLRRELAREGGGLDIEPPRPLGVARSVGWLAAEVPGKLRLDERRREGLAVVDVRQLPSDLVRSAVSPILLAYRYDVGDFALGLTATRLPDKEMSTGSIDAVRAFTVLSPDGKRLTEMRLTLRNRLRHELGLAVPEGSILRSAQLDGQPVKASRGDDGRVRLPLERSRGGDRLGQFELTVVFEVEGPAPGPFGRAELALPAVDLPISSLQWSVFAPARDRYGAPQGDVAAQQSVGLATWRRPPAGADSDRLIHVDAAPLDNPAAPLDNPAAPLDNPAAPLDNPAVSASTGSMPVRINVPRAGHRLDNARYWIPADQPVRMSVWHLRGWLRYPIALALLALALLGLDLARRRRGPGIALATAAGLALHAVAGPVAVVATAGLGAMWLAWRGRWTARAIAATHSWFDGIFARIQAALAPREDGAPRWTIARAPALVWKAALGSGIACFALLAAALCLGLALRATGLG